MMNTNFNIENTKLEDVKIITPFYVEDDRGYFLKSFEKDIFKSFGLNADVFEDFESYSLKNVIRGLHFQTQNPQTKMVRAIRGRVLDVVVDLRKDSETFGKWAGFELSDINHLLLWIPAGFAHGFRVLSDEAVMSYKCVGKYLKGYDTGIKWNDPDLGIEWEISDPIVSNRDNSLQSMKEFIENFGRL
jgi:dTDP-4-dehydrorhamnose 3,5-epimerase